MNDRFEFRKKYKIVALSLVSIGIICLITGLMFFNGTSERFWANVLLNNYYFLSFALGAVVFIAIHNLGFSGWQTLIQRIPEAMSSFLPVAGILMLLMAIFGMQELYDWSHTDELDPILKAKTAYLNAPFFYVRLIIYFFLWALLAHLIRKTSLRQDLNPDPKILKKSTKLSAIFIVIFALTNSTSSWDWLMSIDAHWYSTIFAWYVFVGQFNIALSGIILLLIFLKSLGYLKEVNKNHFHDLGKYLFGFSVVWMYLWFSQYLLIWYANIPEETIYFAPRLNDFPLLFYLNLILCFAFPLLFLMTTNAKTNTVTMAIVSVVVLVGHWIDLYLMIIPGSVGVKANIGLIEIGTTIAYLGLFIFVVLRYLEKHPLVSRNHPFIEESLTYESE